MALNKNQLKSESHTFKKGFAFFADDNAEKQVHKKNLISNWISQVRTKIECYYQVATSNILRI